MRKAQAKELSKQDLEGHGWAQLCNAGFFDGTKPGGR